MSGIWMDLALLALLAAIAMLLYRLRTAETPLNREVAAEPAGDAGRRTPFARFPAAARQAGLDPGRLRWFYWPAKLVLAAAVPFLTLELWRLLTPPPWLLLATAAAGGFLLPDLALLLARRRRQQRVRQALSFFLDLLVALLTSGLSLEEAFRRAGREGLPPSHPLAREIRLTGLEIEAGEERGTAFRALAERTGVPELKAVAAALNLAVRHGTSVETALATQADLLRTKRRENARREISAAATKAIFPLFLCGFPVFFVVVFFPAILEMIETFRALAGLF